MKTSTPSDYALMANDYTNGNGFYTNHQLISGLLQIGPFSASTSPTLAEVGELIKRTEDFIDEFTRDSWRPIFIENEYHDFEFQDYRWAIYQYRDYVGQIRLHNESLRKIIRLEAWQGSSWKELASATASVTVSDYTNTTNITLQLPNSGTTYTLVAGTSAAQWNKAYGNKTAAQDLAYLINETHPVKTSSLTGATATKRLSGSTDTVSKYFYATVDSEDESKVIISSLLLADDGSNCSITVTGSGLAKTDFTDNEEMARLNNYWTMQETGDIYFRSNYPYTYKHSIRVSYISGNIRVPAIITDAATKLVACELLQSDDSTMLIGDASSNIDLKSKMDTWKLDATKELELKKRLMYYLDAG
tara:strand:- start:147 stop:1229 length:1083 start_codon:yes stop_codon:yes gene_type:complete